MHEGRMREPSLRSLPALLGLLFVRDGQSLTRLTDEAIGFSDTDR